MTSRWRKIIHAEVPLAEMFGYATALRSATQGRATYSMEFVNMLKLLKQLLMQLLSEIKSKLTITFM